MTATDLIIEWLNTNSPYKAQVRKAGSDLNPYPLIEIRSFDQVAWLYTTEHKRWSVKPGLYLMADASAAQKWEPRELPPLGDPGYFDALVAALRDGPKPFTP